MVYQDADDLGGLRIDPTSNTATAYVVSSRMNSPSSISTVVSIQTQAQQASTRTGTWTLKRFV